MYVSGFAIVPIAEFVRDEHESRIGGWGMGGEGSSSSSFIVGLALDLGSRQHRRNPMGSGGGPQNVIIPGL